MSTATRATATVSAAALALSGLATLAPTTASAAPGQCVAGNPTQSIAVFATYRVGSGSFLITGGDNFWEFANGANTADTGLNDLSSWVDYVKAAFPLTDAETPRFV